MGLYWQNMSWHGSGTTPLYQIILVIGKRGFRASWGGYGYVKHPTGCWCWLPRRKSYRGTAYYLNWLAGSLCYLPNACNAVSGAERIKLSFRKAAS